MVAAKLAQGDQVKCTARCWGWGQNRGDLGGQQMDLAVEKMEGVGGEKV